MFSKLTIIGSSLAISCVSAWSNQGHLLVGRVAYDKLKHESPETLKNVETALEYLHEIDPNWTQIEKDHAFVEAQTFADFIKYKGGMFQQSWHFKDTPYFDQGGSYADFPKFKLPPHDASECIESIISWFNHDEDSYYRSQIVKYAKPGHTERHDLSAALRFMMHNIGDLHQPLHSSARVNEQYPAGDKGGNGFPVKSHYGAKNLHSVWDKVVYHDHKNMKLPLSDDDWTKLGAEAARITNLYGNAALEKQSEDLVSQDWLKEDIEITKKWVYTDIKEGDLPSQEYQETRSAVAEAQIVLGGFRLAHILENLDFSKFNISPSEAAWMQEEQEKKDKSIFDMVKDAVNDGYQKYLRSGNTY